MTEILILYYSRSGHTAALAAEIRHGVIAVPDCAARVRTVAPLHRDVPAVPDQGPPYVSKDDLRACAGLALGSPTRFGNMAAPLKYFLDGTGGEWIRGTLTGKPACVFTSTATMHGGNESTLLSMMLPLLHHGMLIVGIPFTEAALNATVEGGTPYGASHVAGMANDRVVSETEKQLAFVLGKRLAAAAQKLAA